MANGSKQIAEIFKFEGRVQGVFFRATAAEIAHNIGLHGWVKNLSDGAVEMLAQAERQDIDLFLKKMRQTRAGQGIEKINKKTTKHDKSISSFNIVF